MVTLDTIRAFETPEGVELQLRLPVPSLVPQPGRSTSPFARCCT